MRSMRSMGEPICGSIRVWRGAYACITLTRKTVKSHRRVGHQLRGKERHVTQRDNLEPTPTPAFRESSQNAGTLNHPSHCT
jgi:hypothetical protein